MKPRTEIPWAEWTCNPWDGCLAVSEACANCYAESLAKRWGHAGRFGPGSRRHIRVDKAIAELRAISRWCVKNDHVGSVFIESTGDFFEDHPQLSAPRAQFLAAMRECPNLIYLLLTKRPENIVPMIQAATPPGQFPALPDNFLLGTTIESPEHTRERADALANAAHMLSPSGPSHALHAFWSVEPMLGPVGLEPASCYPDWVICGCEKVSGRAKRPMNPEWVRALAQECAAEGIPFFLKQIAQASGKVTTDPLLFPDFGVPVRSFPKCFEPEEGIVPPQPLESPGEGA